MINPLLLSVQNIDFDHFTQSVIVLIQNAQNGTVTFKNLINLPYTFPIVFFAMIPLSIASLMCVMCIPNMCFVQKCSASHKYYVKEKKLTKSAKKILKHNKIKTKSGFPIDIVLNNQQIPINEKEQLILDQYQLKVEQENLQKTAKCSKACYYIWLITSLVFVLSIVFTAMGTAYLVNIPYRIDDVANYNAKKLSKMTHTAANGLNNVFNKMFGVQTNIGNDLISLSQADFDVSITKFKEQANQIPKLEIIRNSLNQLNKGLTEWFGSVLFYPDVKDTFDYQKSGQKIINEFINKLSTVDVVLKTIYSIIDSINKAIQEHPEWNMSIINFPDITNDPLMEILDVLAIQNVTKWMFANKFQEIFLNNDRMLDILIQKDYNGNNKTIQSAFELFNITADQFIVPFSQIFAGILNPFCNFLIKVKKSYVIESIYKLEKITFDEFMIQMQSQCEYIWCDLVDPGFIHDFSLKLQAIFPKFLRGFVTFNTVPQAISRFEPIVYIFAIGLPILLFILALSFVLCKQMFVSWQQVLLCPFYIAIVAIFGALLLCISIIPSGALTPICNQLESNSTIIVDGFMDIGHQAKIIGKGTELILPTNLPISFKPEKLYINTSTWKTIIDSFNFSITINPPFVYHNITDDEPDQPKNIIDLLFYILDFQDFNQALYKIENYVNEIIVKPIHFSFSNMDISKIFNGDDVVGIIDSINIDNLPFSQFVVKQINQITGGFLDDNFAVFYAVLNPNKTQQRIQSLNVNQLLQNSFNFDVQKLVDQTAQSITPQLQKIYCSVNSSFKSSKQNDLIQSFAELITVLKKTIDPNIGFHIDIPASSDNSVQILQSRILNMQLEYKSDNNQTIFTQDPIEEAKQQIISAIFNADGSFNKKITDSLDQFIDISGEIDENIDLFATFYYTQSPTAEQYQDMIQNQQDIDKLIAVPQRFFNNLISKQVIMQAIAKPTSLNDPNYNAYFQVACKYYYFSLYMKDLLDNTQQLRIYAEAAQIITSTFFQIVQLQIDIQQLNDQLLGYSILDITCTQQQNPKSTSFIVRAPDLAFDFFKSLFQNVFQTVSTDSKYNIFQQAFITSKAFSNVQSFVSDYIEALLNCFCSSQSVFASNLLNVVPSAIGSGGQAVLGFSDAFSFSSYLGWLFGVVGSIAMGFAVDYLQVNKNERKKALKYGIQFKEVKIYIKKGKEYEQITDEKVEMYLQEQEFASSQKQIAYSDSESEPSQVKEGIEVKIEQPEQSKNDLNGSKNTQ
ncbi:Conserved_hypothetical protein [Hexamita inflata]|uniref:Transmembrane protein n=1 Tax=Hexamita inflata TaxID=28002 RepID=A0AA86QBV0_9EUKA|nr:Conserved hypothetical protein [Hexamita inflata]